MAREMSPRARAEAIARAKTAMAALEANPDNGQRALGYARDAINTVWNNADAAVVTEAVDLIETMAHQKGAAA